MRDIEGIEKVVEKLQSHWPEIDAHFAKENERFKNLMAQDHDLMGQILKCHLIVEYYMTRYLKTHYVIEDLDDLRLNFYLKARLLPNRAAAAAFVKPGILNLNSVRNKFAHDLSPTVNMSDLVQIREVLKYARSGVRFPQPIDAIRAFTTVACTFLIIPSPTLQQAFIEAFADIRVNMR